jgi:hypothetical protein
MHHVVNDIDYVRETMVVDVRYRATSHISERNFGKQLLAVKR